MHNMRIFEKYRKDECFVDHTWHRQLHGNLVSLTEGELGTCDGSYYFFGDDRVLHT